MKSQKDSEPHAVVEELRKQNTQLQAQIISDEKKIMDVTTKYEQLEERHVLVRAQLTTQNEQLEAKAATMKTKMSTMETELARFKRDNIDLSRKVVEMQTRCKDLESKSSQNAVIVHEKNRLLASLQEKSHQYELLISENEMNKDLSEQLKKEVNITDTHKIQQMGNISREREKPCKN